MTADSLASGDLRESMTALRDVLIGRILGAEPKETAPLAKQLAEVLKTLDGLPGEEKSDLDDLRDAREKRRAKVS